jgi:methyl-accepting chemotaxis protein
MHSMTQAMAEINAAGQNISKIIKTIEEIAFQTNLLGVNAAVEAARAGQHGKGFAVVAEEVRNLAARSAKAAQETAELIEGTVEKTQNGTRIAKETADALGNIVEGVGKVSDLVGEIAAAANEQAEGVAQVNVGLSQIDQVTQQNTASAEQSAAAAEQLSSQAEQLRQMLGRFRLADTMGTTTQRALPGSSAALQAPAEQGWGGAHTLER